MRTADRMMAKQWRFPLGIEEPRDFMEGVVKWLEDAPVLVADNVAAYVAAQPAFTLESFPSVAPPWPLCWIEYPSSSGRQRRGVLVCDTTDFAGAGENDHMVDLSTNARRHALIAEGVEEGDVRWVITLMLFIEEDRQVWGPAGMFALALDGDGRVIGNRWSVSPVISTSPMDIVNGQAPPLLGDGEDITIPTIEELEAMTVPEREAVLERMLKARQELDSDVLALEKRIAKLDDAVEFRKSLAVLVDSTEHDWLLRALSPALQAIAFLHVKNVALDVHDSPAKVQAKRKRNGKEPLVRFHTLRLVVPRRSGEHGGGNGSGADLSAAHIVAGHFSHYGACCANHEPKGLLFGRLTGVYWVPSHVRGDREAGRVKTDFDLRVSA